MNWSALEKGMRHLLAASFRATAWSTALACHVLVARAAGDALVPAGSVALSGVEGRLDHLAYDPKSKRLFVAGLENHTVEVVDLVSRTRVHEIVGVREPQGLLFLPQHNLLLVCSRGDGTCRSFDATTFLEGPWIDLGRNADNVRYDLGSRTVYVGSAGEPGNGLFSAIDLRSLLLSEQGGQPSPPRSPADLLLDRPRQADPKTEIPLPSHPESFQIDNANGRIFVNVPDDHEIAVLSVTGKGLSPSATWPVTVGERNFPMALDAASGRLFIATRKPPLLSIYDTGSGKLSAQTGCVGDADDMFFDPVSNRLYVVGGEGFVDVFQVPADGAPARLIGHTPTATRARTGLLLPDLRILAVAAPRTTNSPAAILLFKTGS